MKFASKLERLIDAGAVVVWRPVKDHAGLYEVSNEGDVRSIARTDSKGRPVWDRILKPGKVNKGYLSVRLYKEGQSKMHYVHRLVMQAFVGKCPAGMDTNHLDEDKTNNCVANLQYTTQKQNINHGTRNMRVARANGIPIESFDPITGETIKRYASAMDAERLDGYDHANIIKCIKGRYQSRYGLGWRRSTTT